MSQELQPTNLSAIILAAGKSARTSPENKLLLPILGKTIIRTVLDKMMPLNFPEILVVTGFQQDRIEKDLQNYAVRFIHNPNYKEGMAASIRTGITQSATESDGFMMFLGDMPWIEEAVLRGLIQSFYTNPESAIVVPAFRKRQGNPVIFSKRYKKELLGLTGDNGARSIIEKFPDQVIEVQVPNERLLRDIDTREDYEN